MLHLWNTAKRSLEEIKPIISGQIGFYGCGPTVYQRAHIGNLRTYVAEDVLRRTLELEGLTVTHVMNITDVGHLVGDGDVGEDKMEKSAREQGKDAWDISRMYTDFFLRDLAALNIETPTKMPKATDHIAEQIELIKTLEEKGFTYGTSDGIYFDTAKLPSYGSFGGQKLDEKQEGARVEANDEKRSPSDFALWKLSIPKGAHPELGEGSGTKQAKRQMEWESPWGVGFPGWHIECSAMARKELGQPFDIHAGGVDHIPVHHENEIAQSVAAYGVPLAHTWMHIDFLQVDGHKMSKSLGNTYLLDDLRTRGIDPLSFRFFLLGAHYRTKQNFTWEAVAAAQQALEKLQRIARTWDAPGTGDLESETAFKQALEDDLNTPKALAVMWELVNGELPSSTKASSLLWMDRVFGLGLDQYIAKPLLIPVDIKQLADERWKARQERNWPESDRLRDLLAAKGWSMDDGKESYTLNKK
jgi:cysteinyl-tRNA synthetase